MARKKVRYQLVENESNRRSTFKKRKASFFKKLSELSTLCGVPACAVVYNGSNQSEPDTWPSPEGTSELLARFSAMSAADQTKQMLDGDGFLQKQVAVLQRHLKKVEGESANLASEILLNELLSGRRRLADVASLETLKDMSLLVETRLKAVHKRLDELKPVQEVEVPGQQGADVAHGNKWLSDDQVVGLTESGIAETVPVGVLRPRADVAQHVGCSYKWVSQVVEPKESGFAFAESVPVSVIRPRADVAPESESFVLEESDKKYWCCESSSASADVALQSDHEDMSDIEVFLNYLNGGGFFGGSDGLC